MADRKPRKLSSLFFSLGMSVAVLALIVAVIGLVLLQTPNIPFSPLFVTVMVTGIVLVVGIAISSHIARKYARPLVKLNDAATKFIEGNYDADFRVDEGPAEVVELSESLQAICSSTRSALSELRDEEQRQAQFVSDVSHEIRTPLTGIRGYAETLLEDDEIPEDMREHFLHSIIVECNRLTRLANDLLALQSADSDESRRNWKRINLREVVEGVQDMLDPLLESRHVTLSIGGEAPDVLGDHDKLTQVMVNLIENASRFAQGHVRVELSGVNGQSVVTVSDDGPGFGDTDPARLFDRFYRNDPSRQSATGGSGLGLAIVKSIVTAHDGTVEAFNIPSGGACFLIAIPSVGPAGD
jgi:two-component system OmpR family sensor kinase